MEASHLNSFALAEDLMLSVSSKETVYYSCFSLSSVGCLESKLKGRRGISAFFRSTVLLAAVTLRAASSHTYAVNLGMQNPNSRSQMTKQLLSYNGN